jgi:hypothetical protein
MFVGINLVVAVLRYVGLLVVVCTPIPRITNKDSVVYPFLKIAEKRTKAMGARYSQGMRDAVVVEISVRERGRKVDK